MQAHSVYMTLDLLAHVFVSLNTLLIFYACSGPKYGFAYAQSTFLLVWTRMWAGQRGLCCSEHPYVLSVCVSIYPNIYQICIYMNIFTYIYMSKRFEFIIDTPV